jgi:hypothetical protein
MKETGGKSLGRAGVEIGPAQVVSFQVALEKKREGRGARAGPSVHGRSGHVGPCTCTRVVFVLLYPGTHDGRDRKERGGRALTEGGGGRRRAPAGRWRVEAIDARLQQFLRLAQKLLPAALCLQHLPG